MNFVWNGFSVSGLGIWTSNLFVPRHLATRIISLIPGKKHLRIGRIGTWYSNVYHDFKHLMELVGVIMGLSNYKKLQPITTYNYHPTCNWVDVIIYTWRMTPRRPPIASGFWGHFTQWDKPLSHLRDNLPPTNIWNKSACQNGAQPGSHPRGGANDLSSSSDHGLP